MTISILPDPTSINHGEWARFIFVAGRLCIDFTQTGGETGKRAYWERFHAPSDLADWLAVSPLQLQDLQVSTDDFKTALILREAIWRVAEAVRQNETPLAADIETINRIAAEPDLPPQLELETLQHA
ncbi:MAG TPA: ABATE domain-containing protein, partial [Anaerolineales bacterium]